MFLNLNWSGPLRGHRGRPAFRPQVECLEGRDTPSTTVLAVSPNPGTGGQPVTLTATVTKSGADFIQPGTGAPSITARVRDRVD